MRIDDDLSTEDVRRAALRQQRREAKKALTAEPESPPTVRERVYLLLEEGYAAGGFSVAFDIFLVVLIVANLAAAMLDSIPSIDDAYGSWFDLFEAVSIAIFSVEYVLRIWSAIENPRFRESGPFWGRVRFALQPIALIDFLAVVPSFFGLFFGNADLRALRVFRLLRILKIVRYSPALTTLTDVLVAEWRALLGTLLLLICVMVLSAEAMYLIEGTVNPKSFGTLPQAMYWAITTLTTVGYGDNVPVTALGKLVSGITMIVGLGLFALPVGIVATNFVNEIHRRDFVVTWSMLARVPLFKSFDVETIVTVMGFLRSQVLREHAVLTLEGAPADEMFFIVSGRARGEYDGGSFPLGPGDHYGEAAILRGQPYDATIVARSDMRLLSLSASDFALLIRKFPKLKRRFEVVTQRRRDRRKRDAPPDANAGGDE